MSTLAVIVGSTGVGKTDLSIRLAQQWHCPIVNCDSRQIYRDLPIGTAAPTEEEMACVKHYMVGTHGLEENYNAGLYARDAVALLTELATKHKENSPFAILTGGSMLYIDAVCKGLDDIPKTDFSIREKIQEAYQNNGLEWLQSEVAKADPEYYAEVDKQNPQRLIHCLEVCQSSGRPFSSFRTRTGEKRPWEHLIIGLTRNREELYERINLRVEKMMADGLEEEARKAYRQVGEPEELPNSLNTVGYREMIHYIRGEWTIEEAVRMIQQNSRHYAKRQMTWFRGQKDIHWVEMNQPMEMLVEEIDRYSKEKYQINE